MWMSAWRASAVFAPQPPCLPTRSPALRGTAPEPEPRRLRQRRARTSLRAARASRGDYDAVVVGSGIGGLCAAATLARYGKKVLCVEAHDTAGGAAHGFKRRVPKLGTFRFDTGPSFFSGLSAPEGARINPLKAVLDLLETEVLCHGYESFGLCLPEGHFTHTSGFKEVLAEVSGEAAVKEWEALLQAMKPLAALVEALPVPALRFDPSVLLTAGPFLPKFLAAANPLDRSAEALQLKDPFAKTLSRAGLKDPFARRWLDLLCFCLSGLPADGTVTAEMAMMFGEFYKPGATMDYPVGGVQSLVRVLTEALAKYQGELRLRAEVEEILVERNKACGIRLTSGEELRCSTVICNTSCWDLMKLLPPGSLPDAWRRERESTPACRSFMHLHLGFDMKGLDALQEHYICLEDWGRGVDAEENALLISIPSVEDKTLAPEGFGVLHAYTPATESWERWKDLDRKSQEYQDLKEARVQFLWRQLERVIPDLRQRAKVQLVGTPLTHRRFLRRFQGSYGPAISAKEGQEFPGPLTPLPGLLLCGDSCFPGIGVPAVAASGLLAAHASGLDTLRPQADALRRLFG
ncbi:unnamed protein product [Effrenium voratum]|nr:unnamed protein product [Effrenium voratum]